MHVCPAQPAHAACPGTLGSTKVGGSQYKKLEVTKLHINQIRAVLNCFQAIQKTGIRLSWLFCREEGREKKKERKKNNVTLFIDYLLFFLNSKFK